MKKTIDLVDIGGRQFIEVKFSLFGFVIYEKLINKWFAEYGKVSI